MKKLNKERLPIAISLIFNAILYGLYFDSFLAGILFFITWVMILEILDLYFNN